MRGESNGTAGAAGALNTSKLNDRKVGRIILKKTDGSEEVLRKNVILTIGPGETCANANPGGGGYGDPFERDIAKVADDVKNGLVSVEAAGIEYGVVIDPATLVADEAASAKLRAQGWAEAG